MRRVNLKNIELLLLDVDGVLTDGRIILTPSGEEIKEFHVRDGSGMKFWRRVGKRIAIVTGRASPAVELRAKGLDVDALRMGAKDKYPAYRSVLDELKMSPSQTAVVGDDLPDLPLLLDCGFAVAVADAVDEVKQAADHVTARAGGHAAVREVIELILKETAQWDSILARYREPRAGQNP
jgi:3-deoxy-D-manno-octulosonate 8-phosphate phosphatase (KDO 8-P phosphatase)